LAKNVYQKYTLGMHQLNHDQAAQLIWGGEKFQKGSG
jgi:hypothetical protein